MQDSWVNRLSEYLDEELDRDECLALEGHLAGCPECASTLAELRQVRVRAHELEDAPPPASLWARSEAGIAARRTFPTRRAIAPEGPRNRASAGPRFSFSVPS